MKKNNIFVKKPWGGYEILEKKNNYWIKKLFINAKSRFSLQSHKNRSEVWIVLRGKIIAQVGDILKRGRPLQAFIIRKKQKHRITGMGNACILEISFGKPKERDIIRYADDYGRADFAKN